MKKSFILILLIIVVGLYKYYVTAIGYDYAVDLGITPMEYGSQYGKPKLNEGFQFGSFLFIHLKQEENKKDSSLGDPRNVFVGKTRDAFVQIDHMQPSRFYSNKPTTTFYFSSITKDVVFLPETLVLQNFNSNGVLIEPKEIRNGPNVVETIEETVVHESQVHENVTVYKIDLIYSKFLPKNITQVIRFKVVIKGQEKELKYKIPLFRKARYYHLTV